MQKKDWYPSDDTKRKQSAELWLKTYVNILLSAGVSKRAMHYTLQSNENENLTAQGNTSASKIKEENFMK